jgi:hypothetical protein
MDFARPRVWRDAALATAIALLLTFVWTVRDWAALSALHLPDTDDVVRLQQIRDWLGGQAFSDLTQHRLGIAGVEMHWSRLPDLVPAAIIVLLTPVLGAHGAELAAVIAWPALLFIAALTLTGAIAQAVRTSAPTAIVVAALAYPASALFLPGRIDHHGLQLVLLLALVFALLGRGSWAKGIATGLASAASLVIGMETAPLLAAGGSILVVRWIVDGAGERARIAGYGLALSAGLAAAALLLRTSGWGYPACDGFAMPLWRAAQIAALAPLALGMMAPWLPNVRVRLATAGLLGAVALAAALALSPLCLRPYGGVDPLLARIWLANVAEAQSLFAAPFDHAIGYTGLLVVGLGATAWVWLRSRRIEWLIIGLFQLVSLLIALAQLRGAYAGAMLAAPALAGLIAAARERGTPALAVAWVISAGLLYPIAGAALSRPSETETGARCDAGVALAVLARQPHGTVAAPMDLGAYALAATRHRVLAAPYHRNNVGNRTLYRMLLAAPEMARRDAVRTGVTYLVDCPGAHGELGTLPAGSLLAALRAGTPPVWLRPLPGGDDAAHIYLVAR